MVGEIKENNFQRMEAEKCPEQPVGLEEVLVDPECDLHSTRGRSDPDSSPLAHPRVHVVTSYQKQSQVQYALAHSKVWLVLPVWVYTQAVKVLQWHQTRP